MNRLIAQRWELDERIGRVGGREPRPVIQVDGSLEDRARSRGRFEHQASAVRAGVITRRWIQRISAGRTRGVQYWLDYSYEAPMPDGGTREWTGSENVWFFRYNRLEEGTSVQVEYAASNPELSRLRS